MTLETVASPAVTRKWGEQILEIGSPSNLKIQTTGPGATTLLEQGPEPGKTWHIMVRVEIHET